MIEKAKTIGNQIAELFPKGIYSYSEVNGELVLKNEKERIISYITTLEQDYFKLGYADASEVFEKMRNELEIKAREQYRSGLHEVLQNVRKLPVVPGTTSDFLSKSKVENMITNMLYGKGN